MGSSTRYSTWVLTKECGVRKKRIGAASRIKKKKAANAAGKNRRRMGDAWIKMMNAAINARSAAVSIPCQPAANQAAPLTRIDETAHHIQTSASINGSLTKRRKYSELSNFPI